MSISKTDFAISLKNDNFSLLSCAFMLAVFLSLFGMNSGDKALADGSSNVLRQGTWILFGLLSFVQCFHLRRRLDVNLKPTLALFVSLMLFMYCLMSYSWSHIPFITLKRAVLFGLVIFLCFATFAKRQGNPDGFLSVLAIPLSLLLILSFLVVILIPSVGVTSQGWRGVTSFKNEFGQLCAIAFLVFIFGVKEFKARYWAMFFCMLALVGLIMSQSSTCTLAVLIGTFSSLAVLFLRKSSSSKLVGIGLLSSLVVLACVILCIFVFKGDFFDNFQDKIFALLGKSSTLTGRTKLWSLVMDNVRFHSPWVGGGYGGFWDGLGSPANFTAYRFPGGYVGQAHNGYIDIFNDLGYVGIFLLVVILCLYFRNIVNLFSAGAAEFYFHFAFFVFIVIENYAESTFFRLVGFLNIIFFASLARASVWSVKNRP